MINQNVMKRIDHNLAIITSSLVLLTAATGAIFVMVTTNDVFAVDPEDKVAVDPITNCFNLVGQADGIDSAEAYAQHYEKFRILLPSEMKLYGFTQYKLFPSWPL